MDLPGSASQTAWTRRGSAGRDADRMPLPGPADRSDRAMTESARSLQLKGLRVLVVEDEALVAVQLEDMLADLGCAIIGPASRVCQALDLLARRATGRCCRPGSQCGGRARLSCRRCAGEPRASLHLRHGLWRHGVDRALPQPACAPEAVSTEPAPQGDAGQAWWMSDDSASPSASPGSRLSRRVTPWEAAA